MADLHITNGDDAANILKDSVIEGDVLPWRDTMHYGPFPADVGLDQLSAIRARYFTRAGLDPGEVARTFRLRDDHLRAAASYDRVVLWYEHDLLDQLQILQLLNWFSANDLGATSLYLICIDRFEGIEPFRGIGQLSAEQMASLYKQRQIVTTAQLGLAKAGWSAFRSSDPGDLESFMDGDLAPLPFLHAALSRHLEEYPSLQTGLTRTERQVLALVSDGVSDPGRIFSANMDLESALFIGDWSTFAVIAHLGNGAHPLLHCDSGGAFRYRPQSEISREAFRSQNLRLTEAGEQVLAGHRDAFGLLRRDNWLGGVHLKSERPMWTWDADSKSLKIRAP